jgi:phosphoglycolate phosphatase-like HAD superfamily hydrolase
MTGGPLLTRRLLSSIALIGVTVPAAAQGTSDPLPSWRAGDAKEAIREFIRRTTERGSPGFVPEPERIATFDQDGTLWVEQPMYTQVTYCLERVPVLVKQRPELRNVEPFKTVLTGDPAAVGRLPKSELIKILAATLTGMTTERFQSEANTWLGKARHRRWDRPYTDLIYQPMQEVLALFRSSGFKTYIVTGGGQDFVRLYAERVYGIAPEQVVGTAGGTRYTLTKAGQPILTKEPQLLLNDNDAGKPEGIHLMIGRRPRAAFGNSVGDKEMLEYTTIDAAGSLGALILHDDGEREYAYGPAKGLPESKVGTFTQALYDDAKRRGWTVVSMKNDWARIFPFA